MLLPIPKNSNEYRYLKCTAISISILNVEKYWGSISQYPSRYWIIFSSTNFITFFIKQELRKHLKTYGISNHLEFILELQENTYVMFQYFKNKQKTFCKWPSLAAWWSGVMTTTGNDIFVCNDDNQQQQASMVCHAFPI